MRLAYLYSRYPVLSQTFCDTEMLALQHLGFSFVVGSIHSPLTTIRHAHSSELRSPIQYAPPSQIMLCWEAKMRAEKRWPKALIARHDEQYGPQVKAGIRARNAAYFSDLFVRHGIHHIHVHFANRAAHTALFLKEMSGIPFSITAHGQDFMADLGNDQLLCEICEAAEFVAVETEYSRGLLSQRCPTSANKIHRVYNGMNLANFTKPSALDRAETARILSVGRLVPFKGFDVLIEACDQLRRRSVRFGCEIIGDGPERVNLQRRINELQLQEFIILLGALPQEEVRKKLRSCDLFVLASIIDQNGASDIFPTVILEAMASARPVISTTVAGIPEAVVNAETGLLVPAGEINPLADAVELLCRNVETREGYGAAGRIRVESHFQIQTTIQPLIELFEKHAKITPSVTKEISAPSSQHKIAYLIDRWPDTRLPAIETELSAMLRPPATLRAFVCEFANNQTITPKMKRLALQLEFLPDAMAIEAEWQAHREAVLALEEDRANNSLRVPADLFLREARFAIALLSRFGNISHVHATSSNALICGVFLKKLLGISLSASIEPKPLLSPAIIENALQHTAGGRIEDRKLRKQLGVPFIFDRSCKNQGSANRLRRLNSAGKISLTRGTGFWREWATLLTRWCSHETR